MVKKVGFELEGFFVQDGVVSIPPKDYPTDGFPGLVELRNSDGDSLPVAYAKLLVESFKYPGVDFSKHEFTFTPQQRAELRRRHAYKEQWDIQNIYGKYPRALGNRTIASLQVNISNQTRASYTDDKGIYHPAVYSLFDLPKVVRNLDEEFEKEIKEARRQPGEYAVKGELRLEYRSLPNFVFEFDTAKAKAFLDRIEGAING